MKAWEDREAEAARFARIRDRKELDRLLTLTPAELNLKNKKARRRRKKATR
jgi:hypothetical protein